ncbi:MAG: NACHT domain-containing protein [Cruoricaptor ignavus]|nr:NACHT domain-containing protein [Cruoricaptor ignavus]
MSEETVSASGERAAIGGYLPQFDEFAWFVYLNLINNNLEWIRVADPKAEKLDDIQYSTHSELHAYQVKWTIADANISFANFTELIPLISSSWKSLKTNNPSKRIIPHLITNKPVSSHDSLKDGDAKIGSFKNFIDEVWTKLKSNHTIDSKWNPIIAEFKKATKLNSNEFNEFVRVFDFQPNYKQKKFSIRNTRYSKEDEDLQQISRFIIEKIASAERGIQFNRQEIIKELGWGKRFKTFFNHELIVDRQRYQPIQSTIDLLNSKLVEHKGGYLFLLGSPGSGKSTLLNQWSKGLKTRIVRYYAFDFVNPSSHLNFYERGNATHLFFDLVFQLKEVGIYKRDILPYRDLLFLKDVFNEQLKSVGEDFATSGQQTIIIIDGLDHVPREYKSPTNSFLRELPLPSTLPEGVFIILGSQSYDLEDIQQEIKTEFQKDDRTVPIDSLKKEEVYKYINNLNVSIQLSDTQKLLVFEKSQGHPLYLSYLIEKIIESDSVDDTINSFETIGGSIETYYKKIWKPIQKEESLIHFLGLIARVNGSINIQFVQEWGIDRSVLKSFKENAKVLFNETENTLSFFHNSFKQFLLYHTSLNYLTNVFDQEENLKYHSQLAEYYLRSKVEKPWKQNHHLFQAQQYDKFVSEVTPDNFTAQLLDFRPVEEIKQDAKLGIEVARQTKDINTLVRYLFSLAEIERRQFNIDPASFTEEYLIIGKPDIARNYLRTGNILHCSNAYAFKASRLFMKFGYNSESATLFNLAYPEIIADSGITIADSHRYEEIRDSLEEWVYTAPYFETTEIILSKIEKIEFSENTHSNRFEEKEADLHLRLIANLGYSLIDQSKWDDLKTVLGKIGTSEPKERNTLFQLIQYAIEQCLELNDNSRANEYLSILISQFTKEKTKPIGKIYIADLVFKVTQNIDETLSWIGGIEQPLSIDKYRMDYDGSLEPFIPLIKLNKLLNSCGKGIAITSAIPSAIKGSDEEVLVEFERMLCLITQILTDGILQNTTSGDLTKRVYPIIRFYYKDISHRNSYWYKLKQAKGQYFNFLIFAVSQNGKENIEALGVYLFKEFADNPKYWSTSDQRKIIESLLNNGFNSEKAKKQLSSLETSMLDDRDIDSRVTECVSHSKVWLILGEIEIGEKWLKQSIQESIGVGYRKDYQFSTWIEWLRKINLKDPTKATEKIKWFLSHLNHIKETTEGRAYWNASEELLDATYEHNLNDGLEQTVWQLENNLVDFRDSITLFIKRFVNRVKNENEFKAIVLLYNGLYMLLAESANTSLLKTILKKGYEILQVEFLERFLPTVISAINIKAYEENRHYLLSEIESFCSENGIKIQDYYSDFKVPLKNRRDDSSSYFNSLTLKDSHERIDENEVLKRVENFDDFRNIVQQEDQANSYFNWSKIINKIASSLTSSQINEVANIIKIENRKSDFYAKLSEVAFEIGDNKLAESLAIKSLELSSPSGWVKFYDGGTRINAFKALRKINSTSASAKAFEVLVHDITSGNYPSSYIEHLDDILPLLTENYVEEEIWVEVFGYLQRLMSNSKPAENLPLLQSVEKPISETLVDYLLYLSKNPVSLIREESILLLAEYINQNNEYALAKLLNEGIDDYTSMDVIMSLRELNSPKIEEVKSIIQNFALSKDYLLRENAKQILDELGKDIPASKNIDLPSIYSLHLPEPQILEINKKIDPYYPNVDITNPRDLIRPFEFLIRVLSEESGIDESNLIYRAYSIMKEIGNKEEWTIEYEKKLRNHLEQISLEYSYPRPRVIVARRAIMHVTNELIHSGTIDDEKLRDIFISHDYAVSHFNEIEKPEFIQMIKEREFGGVGNGWLDRIGESKRLNESLLSYNETFKIIAEYNQVKNLDWGSPTEEYMYQLAVNDKLDKSENFIFGSVFHQLSSNYHNISGGGHFIIVIIDHRFNRFDIKSNWIAINPALARHLGWLPEPKKLFAWKNSKGELMAESIYWANGNIQMNPRKDAEVGEGWFVVVSETAYKQINSIEQNLFLQKKLVRTKYEDLNLMTTEIFKINRI